MTDIINSNDIDIKQIMKLIPHRYPFLLIDKVVNLVIAESAIGIKNVTINEPHFQGHFPDHPVMPGVLTIEAMAQTAAVLALKSTGSIDKLVYFMSIDEAKFRSPVIPGDVVYYHIKVIQKRTKIWKFSGEARVADKCVANANFVATIV